MTQTAAQAVIINGIDVRYDTRTGVIEINGNADGWGEEGTADVLAEYHVSIVEPVMGWGQWTHLARVWPRYADQNRRIQYALVECV